MTETTSNHTHTPEPALLLGQELRQLRESRQLSIGEVAERLKLPARQIEALEQANYEGLPEAVFIRGFLRSYGRFLGMNENRLSEALEQIFPTTQVSRNIINHATPIESHNKKRPTWLIGVIAAVLIGGGIYAWQSKSSHHLAEQESSIDLINQASAASNLENIPTTTQAMSASETQVQEQASAASGVAQSGTLIIRPRYRTMLTVRNAKGEVLINKIVAGQTEHQFTEGAPFEVRVGYAIGATAEFNGEIISLDSKRQGKTAVFTVGETSASAAQ